MPTLWTTTSETRADGELLQYGAPFESDIRSPGRRRVAASIGSPRTLPHELRTPLTVFPFPPGSSGRFARARTGDIGPIREFSMPRPLEGVVDALLLLARRVHAARTEVIDFRSSR
jgi:hypothetical protein